MLVISCVRMGVCARARACERVTLIIKPRTRHHIVICGLSGSTILCEMFSSTARFSEEGHKIYFSLQLLFQTILIVKIIQRDIIINVEIFLCEVPGILIGF